MATLKQQYNESKQLIGEATWIEKMTQAEHIYLYARRKQAESGDCKGAPPLSKCPHIEKKMKTEFNAWKKIVGKTKAEAAQEYVDKVAELKAKYEEGPVMVVNLTGSMDDQGLLTLRCMNMAGEELITFEISDKDRTLGEIRPGLFASLVADEGSREIRLVLPDGKILDDSDDIKTIIELIS